MPIDWHLWLSVLSMILRIVAALPPEADHREVCQKTSDALDHMLNGQKARQ